MTRDQLRSIMEFSGGESTIGKIVKGAGSFAEGAKIVDGDTTGSNIQKPVTVDWNGGRAGECSNSVDALMG